MAKKAAIQQSKPELHPMSERLPSFNIKIDNENPLIGKLPFKVESDVGYFSVFVDNIW